MLYPKQMARDGELPMKEVFPLILDLNRRLARSVSQAVKKGLFPVVLGGDHTNAIGTWNGVQGPLALLWIDAHMDAHTLETSPSGAYHGMPLAALLGYGEREMTHLVSSHPVLKPENLAVIGVRSYETGEVELLKRLNVRVYFMDEVKKRGLKEILPEAMQHVMRGAAHFGVSLDLDVFDPQEAPGVGSPEEGGILPSELLPLLPLFGKEKRFAAFELVEFNPDRDLNHKTRDLSYKVLSQVLSSKQ